ncbi:MAG: tetratricopeptide repeat protein [Promethearchaeota archaeon]
MIIPKPNKDSMDKEKPENLLFNADYQEKLKRASKKIKIIKEDLAQNLANELQQDLAQGLKISLKGVDEAIDHIQEIFGDKTWTEEIYKTIEQELETLKKEIPKVKEDIQESKQIELKEKKLDEAGIISILKSIKETGVSAREKRSYDEAIEILQDIDKKLLPAISIHLPEEDEREIRISLKDELATAFKKKGEIDEAIKVIDSCCSDPDYESKDYIHSQIEKSFLLVQKAEFNQAADLLKSTLEYERDLPENERNLKQSAEIKRALAIAYRGQGAYQKAIKWFKEAQKEFGEVNYEIGYHNALWGIGILRHLTGEWEEAIKIWKELLLFFEKQPDTLIKGEKPASFLRINVYTEYARTLQLSGKFKESEEILNKALNLAQKSQYKYAGWSEVHIQLLFCDLYYQQNNYEKASHAIAEARRINDQLKSQFKEPYSELKILKYEINVLLALNKIEEARTLLIDQKDNCKSNWDQASYYHLLGIIEKNEMNFGLAKKAFQSSLEKIKEIGASALSDELMYIELLVEMSRTGNLNAFKEAESLLADLEVEVKEKKISAFILECNLLKAHLARYQSNYDKAYQLYTEIIKDADTYHLFRQKKKALEAINLIEQEGQQLRTTKDLSVYRYLEDARRILEENS